MIVVSPSTEILSNLDEQSIPVRIEGCGRLCYKSEDKITPESAPGFIKTILKHGHNSVAEMAVVTLEVMVEKESIAAKLHAVLPKYLTIDKLEKNIFLITASMRGFRELYIDHGNLKIVKSMTSYLLQHHGLFFKDITPERGIVTQAGVMVKKLYMSELERLPPFLYAKHRFVAVKLTVNRAVTHEMVRHRPCSFLQESQRYCRYGTEKFGNQVTFIKPMFYAEGSDEYTIWQKAMEDTESLYLKLLETSSPQAARTVLPNSCKTELIVFCSLLQWAHIFKLRATKGADPSMREVMIPLFKEFKELYPKVYGELDLDLT